MKKNKEPRKLFEQKSFSFPSTNRAQFAYDQAVQIINERFFMQGEVLVKIEGNVVTVPDWFPFSPSVN